MWGEICSIEFTDVEKARQRRSRIVQILNVPQGLRLDPSLAAALLNGLFQHPVPPSASSRDKLLFSTSMVPIWAASSTPFAHATLYAFC
jgi:hypothetical protein